MFVVSAILLAGGKGLRMQGLSPLPKQYLSLEGQIVALYSFHILTSCPAISEVIVVCEPAYQSYFPAATTFAAPGNRRQDSVENGFAALSEKRGLVLIHDAARPFITRKLVETLICEATHHGAAIPALPVKQTIKQVEEGFVKETLKRSSLYEVQTPQAIRADLLVSGLAYAKAEAITVSDDASLAELLGHRVKIVPGLETNIKITTPFDWVLAKTILYDQAQTHSKL